MHGEVKRQVAVRGATWPSARAAQATAQQQHRRHSTSVGGDRAGLQRWQLAAGSVLLLRLPARYAQGQGHRPRPPRNTELVLCARIMVPARALVHCRTLPAAAMELAGPVWGYLGAPGQVHDLLAAAVACERQHRVVHGCRQMPCASMCIGAGHQLVGWRTQSPTLNASITTRNAPTNARK